MRELILASTSGSRRRMLHAAGVRVRCEAPGVDEHTVDGLKPVELARHLGAAKAGAVSARFPRALVIGADQVAVALGSSEPWGKPPDPELHLAMLKRMRGRAHDLITGWAVVGPGLDHVAHTTTRMHMRPDLTDRELSDYVATGEGSGCAGGYAAEGLGGFLFSRIEGDWYNVLGLPLLEVIGVLRAQGVGFTGPVGPAQDGGQ